MTCGKRGTWRVPREEDETAAPLCSFPHSAAATAGQTLTLSPSATQVNPPILAVNAELTANGAAALDLLSPGKAAGAQCGRQADRRAL